MCVLEMYRGFHHYLMVTCLVGNIIMPGDEEKLDKMTNFELNQYAEGDEYKVYDSFFLSYL